MKNSYLASIAKKEHKNPPKTPPKKWKIVKRAGAGAKCDHHKMKVRTRVRAHRFLDVRGACVRRKNGSQLTPWLKDTVQIKVLN